ncbi:NAD(P)H:quinone oxidoreductase [Nocardioides sp. SYSU DS0651]|uniref:NAD(P)H:quinone oxidoreductase n=1 Tax=Nocardioides sp. SYSU DS0651 TaxID=3415955 RepID=UPI003F4B139F
MEQVEVALAYFSATGTVQALAEAAAEGAEKAGAVVHVHRLPDRVEPAALEPALDDLARADVVLLGTPTRFGTPSAQLKAFVDATGPLWQQGRLAGKVCTAFTASTTTHGGQEATILALGNVFYHWGAIIVPPGYADPVQFRSGNPYGASHVSGDGPPGEVSLEAARFQAQRAVEVAALLKAGRAVA